MADVENGDILRLGAVWLMNSVTIIANTFHVRMVSGGPMDYPDVAEDVSEYLEDIYDEVDTWLSTAMETYALTLANLTQATTFGSFSWTNTMQGIESSSWLAEGLCCLTWGRTLKPRVQTRKYWGVFTENGILNGAWVASVVTACSNAHNLYHTSFVGTNGATMLGVAYNRELATYTEAFGIAATDVPAYQRRRRLGRGA